MSINNAGLTTKQPLLDAVNFTDVTPDNPIRGDLITAQGVTPLWTRLPKGTANQVLSMDATATYIVWATPAGGGGSGTVTHTGTLTAGQLVIGNGAADVTVGNLSGDATTSGGTAAVSYTHLRAHETP